MMHPYKMDIVAHFSPTHYSTIVCSPPLFSMRFFTSSRRSKLSRDDQSTLVDVDSEGSVYTITLCENQSVFDEPRKPSSLRISHLKFVPGSITHNTQHGWTIRQAESNLQAGSWLELVAKPTEKSTRLPSSRRPAAALQDSAFGLPNRPLSARLPWATYFQLGLQGKEVKEQTLSIVNTLLTNASWSSSEDTGRASRTLFSSLRLLARDLVAQSAVSCNGTKSQEIFMLFVEELCEELSRAGEFAHVDRAQCKRRVRLDEYFKQVLGDRTRQCHWNKVSGMMKITPLRLSTSPDSWAKASHMPLSPATRSACVSASF
ncbi:hypothetical protein BKA70DRAFT_1265262 [Coprinopsis sp. MPI-PUGE-AT-0042]|nr:hypothetical protein BKA70DRAFT_1265262 [Coprinopsis sp. MPI-PUGE-AT-0042]